VKTQNATKLLPRILGLPGNITATDAKAIYEYLKAIPPLPLGVAPTVTTSTGTSSTTGTATGTSTSTSTGTSAATTTTSTSREQVPQRLQQLLRTNKC
jgi:carbohydrate-binding DOMON domain-containing protein